MKIHSPPFFQYTKGYPIKRLLITEKKEKKKKII